MAKLNKKKTAVQVMSNLTDDTKSKFYVRPGADGKIIISDKVRKKFTMKDLRG